MSTFDIDSIFDVDGGDLFADTRVGVNTRIRNERNGCIEVGAILDDRNGNKCQINLSNLRKNIKSLITSSHIISETPLEINGVRDENEIYGMAIDAPSVKIHVSNTKLSKIKLPFIKAKEIKVNRHVSYGYPVNILTFEHDGRFDYNGIPSFEGPVPELMNVILPNKFYSDFKDILKKKEGNLEKFNFGEAKNICINVKAVYSLSGDFRIAPGVRVVISKDFNFVNDNSWQGDNNKIKPVNTEDGWWIGYADSKKLFKE